jgi:DNA-binding response OmpR family regulator
VTTVLVATDADEVCDEIDAALTSEDTTVFRVRRGADVEAAVHEVSPDVVIIDLQIGSMGGIASAMNLRLEESAYRMGPQRIILLLDRADDVFLARRSGADGWLVKPLDSRRLSAAVDTVLAGGRVEEGPVPTEAPAGG